MAVLKPGRRLDTILANHGRFQPRNSKTNWKIKTTIDFIDVRTPAEWSMGHIEGAIHLPLTTLLHDLPNIAKDEEVIVTCGVGYRGNIGVSFLQRQDLNMSTVWPDV